MNSFSLNFFKEDDGTKPVGMFIKNLKNKGLQAKLSSDLQRLQIYGNKAKEPLSKHVEGNIFECRTIFGNLNVRTLYFFDGEKIIVATNSFFKKQQKTPRDQIELAKRCMKKYFDRKVREL